MTVPTTYDLVTRAAAGGLTLSASRLDTVPLLQANLAVPLPIGTRADTAALEVLTACWTGHPACARLEQWGGIVTVHRTRKWLLFSVLATSDLLPLLADTLTEVVTTRYTPETVGAAVAKVAQLATLADAQPAIDSMREMWARFYGHLPPEADPSPRAEEVREVTVEQISDVHRRFVVPRHAGLALVGAADPAQCLDHFETALADWRGHDAGPLPGPRPIATPSPGIVSRHRPGRQQTQIRLVAAAQPRTGIADFAANQVAGAVLGGSFASRINTVLREQHGLAYRCKATTDFIDQDVFVIEADVTTSRVPEAMRHLHRLTEEFATTGPTQDELDAAVGFINGAYALNLGSQLGRVALLNACSTQNLPGSALVDIPAATARLTVEDVRRAAAHCHPSRLAGVVVGDAEHFPAQWF
ncbi:M16 family metallopeptidase [Kitasatospora sp. NPDC056181]|uniref:M16 family metallopeptidase n=1 Tax=Kitasatospora sp. NPDC056181 TaxID=3345737 RepID=UPI0035DD2D94